MKIPGPQRDRKDGRKRNYNSLAVGDELRTGTVRAPGKRRGSAVLVILVLLAAMSIIVIANTHTLHALKQELQLLDQRQNQRLNAGPGR